MHDVLNEMGEHLERSLGKRIYKVECVQASPTKIAHVWAGGVAETRAAALEVDDVAQPATPHRSPNRRTSSSTAFRRGAPTPSSAR